MISSVLVKGEIENEIKLQEGVSLRVQGHDDDKPDGVGSSSSVWSNEQERHDCLTLCGVGLRCAGSLEKARLGKGERRFVWRLETRKTSVCFL